MGDAVIVSTARTAIGTARKGTLLDVSAFDLAKYAAGEALDRRELAVFPGHQQGGHFFAASAQDHDGVARFPNQLSSRHSRRRRRARCSWT